MASAPNSASSKGEHDLDESMQNPTDMTAFTYMDSAKKFIVKTPNLNFIEVQNLLVQMVPVDVRKHCVKELDEMGSRIDELEQSINDLKAEMGADVPVKKPEESNPSDISS